MNSNLSRLGIALVCLCSLGGSARAGFLYRYAFDRASYDVMQGGAFDVGVFLEETVTAADVSRLATDGLIGAGARVRFDIPPLPGDPPRVLSLADILPNTLAFDDPAGVFTELLTDSHAQFTETVDILSPPVLGTSIAPDTFRVFLGSFRFTAGSSLGATTIRAEDILATNDIITGAGLELDPFIQSAEATVRVSAVPEPSGLVLLGTGAFGLLAYARQRRRSDELNRREARKRID